MRALFDLLRGPAVTTATHAVRWRGLFLTAIDATTMSVADTGAVRARYRNNAVATAVPATRRCGSVSC